VGLVGVVRIMVFEIWFGRDGKDVIFDECYESKQNFLIFSTSIQSDWVCLTFWTFVQIDCPTVVSSKQSVKCYHLRR
jgi:hypothetical protein